MSIDPSSTYYDQGGIETLKIIKAKLTKEQYKGFLLGNIIKYATRANFKGVFGRDITKIQVYTTALKEYEDQESNAERTKEEEDRIIQEIKRQQDSLQNQGSTYR